MSTLTNRVSWLEARAAEQARRVGGWATYWQSLRKIYGDGSDYSGEELVQLDGLDPAPALAKVIDKV